MINTQKSVFGIEVLREFSTRVFLYFGCPKEDVEQAADVLACADLRGIDSHGVARLHCYFEFSAGAINAKPQIVVSCAPERVDNLGAYRIRSETGILIPSDFAQNSRQVLVCVLQMVIAVLQVEITGRLEAVWNVPAYVVLNPVCLPGEANMRRRVGIFFATTVLISIVLSACSTRKASEEDDKQTAISVVLAHEQACETYDLDKVDSLHTPDARGIEESYPHPFEPAERQGYQAYRDAGVRIEYHPQDAVAEVQGDVAWVTITLHSIWTSDTPAGRVMLGGNAWHVTFVESVILERTPKGWKIALGHTSMLPPEFGVEPDYQEHGGMKFVEVRAGSPAAKAGFKAGDVLIEYGGRTIDNYVDYSRLVRAYDEGEKVMVTVMRGHEKITKEVTLEQMQ